MFAGKKSAQIREILISESAWEEMTCLFAPSLAELTSKTGLTETELNRQALIIGLMALCHPDAIAGDLVSAALTGSYSDSTDKLLTRGDNASDSVLMSMRILLHRLSKYEGSDGKVGQINKMMHRLGYFKASDVLREAQ